MKQLNPTDIKYTEHAIGSDNASVIVSYVFKNPADWPAHISFHAFVMPEHVVLNGWLCNQLFVGGVRREPRFTFEKRRGRKPPHLDEMATVLLPWLEWADKQLYTLKTKLDNDAAAYVAQVKASVTQRTRDDVVSRVYGVYYAEAKRRLNTEERIKALLNEAEDATRANIAFNWRSWWEPLDTADYVVLETGRVKLPGAELVAAVDRGFIEAVESLKDGTFTRPPRLSLRGD